jgi:hypothetical protein
MRGLPQKGAYETVVRDAMAIDSLDPAGIYFGTRSGQLYASIDEGKSWEKILEGLPAVLCIRPVLVGDSSATTKPQPKIKIKTSRRTKRPSRKRSTSKSSRRRRHLLCW